VSEVLSRVICVTNCLKLWFYYTCLPDERSNVSRLGNDINAMTFTQRELVLLSEKVTKSTAERKKENTTITELIFSCTCYENLA
jgi:hypothetical protein